MKRTLLLRFTGIIVILFSYVMSLFPAVWDTVYSKNLYGYFPGPWAIFEHDGMLYVSPSGVNEDNPVGTIYKLDPNDLSAHKGKIVISGITAGDHFWDFTSDGEYVYAVNESKYIYVINPASLTITKKIELTGAVENPTCIAYDEDKVGFWITSMGRDKIYFVDKTGKREVGTELGRFSEGVVSMAYDNRTPGGPYLYISLGSTEYSNTAKIGKYNLTTNAYNSNEKSLLALSASTGWNYAGPLYTYGKIDEGKFVLAGMIRAGFDIESAVLYALELGAYPTEDTPAASTEFSVIPAEKGGLSAAISWKNPSTTMDGSVLTSLSSINLYRDGELLETFNNPTPGQTMNYEEMVVGAKLYTYKLIAVNSAGQGLDVVKKAYIGQDTALAVNNLKLTKENGNAKLTWDVPSGGVHDGYIDFSALRYRIERLPDNVTLTTTATGTEFLDNTINTLANYSYVVTPRTAAGYGVSNTSNLIIIGDHIILPWIDDFSDLNAYVLWTIIDNNSDGNTWYRNTSSNNPNVKIDHPRFSSKNDWLISPPFQLNANEMYRLSWFDRASGDAEQDYQLTIGKAATALGQDKVIKTYKIPRGQLFTEKEEYLSVDESGVYYIGWHSTGTSNNGTWVHDLQLDDISLRKVDDVDIQAISLVGPNMPSSDMESVYQVTVKNWGKLAASDFKVSLIDASNAVLATTTHSGSVNFNTEETITVKWIPQTTGEMEIRAKVEIEGDANTSNDISPVLKVNVQEAGVIGVQIGYDNNFGVDMPFDYHSKSSFVQTLYYEEEINHTGLIDSIKYFNDFMSGSIGARRIQLYMKTTDKEELNTWDNMEGAILVFDGEYDFPKGVNECTIALDQPFPYSGGNLIVTSVRPMDTRYFGLKDMFRYSIDYSKEKRTRRYADDKTEFNFKQLGTATNHYTNIMLMMNTNTGMVKGTVTGPEGPVNGANVKAGDRMEASTNSQGEYLLLLKPGVYDVVVSAVGFDSETKNIVVEKESDLSLDFELQPISKVKVSGAVVDENDNPVAKAYIQLNGYQDYQIQSDEEGLFSIPDVFINEEYDIIVERLGHIAYTAKVEVMDADLEMETIVLNSCDSKSVQALAHEITGEDSYDVTLNWLNPRSENGEVFGKALYLGNDSIVTTVGCARDGWDISEVYNRDGFGVFINKNEGVSAADDFILSEDGYITDIDFYAYQGNATVPKIKGVYVQIYDGKPGDGGNIIWGDLETNVLEVGEFMKCYRVRELSDFGLTDKNAAIVRTKAKIGHEFEAGTYWVEVTFESVDSNQRIVMLQPTARDHRIIGNGIVSIDGEWQELQLGEISDYAPIGIAFRVNGVPAGEDHVTNYKVYRDEKLLDILPHYRYEYLNSVPGEGDYKYEVSAVWNSGCESESTVIDVHVDKNPCEIANTVFPFIEDFDDGSIKGCWTQELINGSRQWELSYGVVSNTGSPGYAHSGNFNLYYYASSSGKDSGARISIPMMDVTALEKPVLNFWHAQGDWGPMGAEYDVLTVYYKEGLDGELIELVKYDKLTKDWTEREIELPSIDNLCIVLEAISGAGVGVVIDDIQILDKNNCNPVSGLGFVLEQEGELEISWIPPVTNSTEFKYTLTRDGETLASGLTQAVYIDTTIEEKTYEYCVTVEYLDKDCQPSKHCKSVTIVYDECEPVWNLQAVKEGVNNVKLNWEAEWHADFYTFAITRGTDLIGDISDKVEYIDENVPVGTHTYGVSIIYRNRTCVWSEPEFVTISVGVGIEDVIDTQVKVYPNPVEDGFTKVEGVALRKVDVLNLSGQVLETIAYTGAELEYTIPMNYPSGVYFLKMETIDNKVITKKIVIK